MIGTLSIISVFTCIVYTVWAASIDDPAVLRAFEAEVTASEGQPEQLPRALVRSLSPVPPVFPSRHTFFPFRQFCPSALRRSLPPCHCWPIESRVQLSRWRTGGLVSGGACQSDHG